MYQVLYRTQLSVDLVIEDYRQRRAAQDRIRDLRTQGVQADLWRTSRSNVPVRSEARAQ